jgi:hypothetical protein
MRFTRRPGVGIRLRHGLPEDFFTADISDLRCRIGASGEELDTEIIGQG